MKGAKRRPYQGAAASLERARVIAKALAGLPEQLASSHPKLRRGRVWCRQCGASRAVAAAACLVAGWPRCCGATMTIDAPAERDS